MAWTTTLFRPQIYPQAAWPVFEDVVKQDRYAELMKTARKQINSRDDLVSLEKLFQIAETDDRGNTNATRKLALLHLHLWLSSVDCF